uniref:Ribonuclease H, related n=1 Tax=Medicago truncatula TaxID=3880 RepID=A2Q5T3_MEDTR|nr:Ribonuclease H, related [Medicago truncatula]
MYSHDRLPTDENLQKRGCSLASVCIFCMNQSETSSHLFLNCPLSLKIRSWLSAVTDLNLDLDCWNSLLLGDQDREGQMVHQIMSAAVIQVIWTLWVERNSRLFQGKSKSVASLKQYYCRS